MEIAQELGLVGVVTQDEIKEAVAIVLAENQKIVQKVIEGKQGPIMSLVGKVMQKLNRRGDPV
jgi:aspartyl-tRNA(Asn)/glutamyl-tRNA(Gln) amidotransferase subunit B